MATTKENNNIYRELRVPGLGIILAPGDMTAEQLLSELERAETDSPAKTKTKKKS